MITQEQFYDLMLILIGYKSDTNVLIGSEIYNNINTYEKRGFNFINVDFLYDKIIFFSEGHPLSGKSIKIHDLFSLENYISSFEVPYIALSNEYDDSCIIINSNYEFNHIEYIKFN